MGLALETNHSVNRTTKIVHVKLKKDKIRKTQTTNFTLGFPQNIFLPVHPAMQKWKHHKQIHRKIFVLKIICKNKTDAIFKLQTEQP